jgi:hypothetical protein
VNIGRKLAFSLIELAVVLGLIAVIVGTFTVDFHGIDFEFRDDISAFNVAIRRARRISLAENHPTILSYNSGKFLIFDAFGRKLSEFERDLHAAAQDFRHVVKFDEFGFFTKFTIECGGVEYVPNALSGILCEKER